MTIDIIISTFQIKKQNPEFPRYRAMDIYATTAGVSSLSSRVERSSNYVAAATGGDWIIDREVNPRCLVKVNLPDSVHYGKYSVDGLELSGLYADCLARDGMGKTVYAYCPVAVVCNDAAQAIKAAIDGGIVMSVPAADGSRSEIPVPIVAVSDLYTDRVPDNWSPELF